MSWPTSSATFCRVRLCASSAVAWASRRLTLLDLALPDRVEDLGVTAHGRAHLRDVPVGHARQSAGARRVLTQPRHLGLQRADPSGLLLQGLQHHSYRSGPCPDTPNGLQAKSSLSDGRGSIPSERGLPVGLGPLERLVQAFGR